MDPFLKAYKHSLQHAKPLRTRRYSPEALTIETFRRLNRLRAYAERNPTWLVPATLVNANRAVTRAATRLNAVYKTSSRKQWQRTLFYTTAQRNAIWHLLLETEPTLPYTNVVNNPNRPSTPNRNLWAWRAEYRRATSLLASRVEEYRALRDQRNAAGNALQVRSTELRDTVVALGHDRAQRRNALGMYARLRRGARQEIVVERRELREQRREYRELVRRTVVAHGRVVRLKARIDTLRQRIAACVM